MVAEAATESLWSVPHTVEDTIFRISSRNSSLAISIRVPHSWLTVVLEASSAWRSLSSNSLFFSFARNRSSCWFPTCQVRVVRFYVSCLLLSSSPLLLLNRDPRRTVFSVGPQPRPSTPSVPCRTSTTTIPAQCSLPDLNHDHPRPVFPAGPQPRVSTPSVPCRTSCRKIWDKECAEES